jgi:hypothetical protein
LCFVSGSDIELLPVAGAIPQLIAFLVALGGERRPTQKAIRESQRWVGHSEFGVDLKGALEECRGAGKIVICG